METVTFTVLGEEACENQDGLAGNGQPRVFEHDPEKHGPVPVPIKKAAEELKKMLSHSTPRPIIEVRRL